MSWRITLVALFAGATIGISAELRGGTLPAKSCEANVCFSDGNCDMTDFDVACRETDTGCANYNCPLE
jgi:hypothetical protein